jgi:hypothetical protein
MCNINSLATLWFAPQYYLINYLAQFHFGALMARYLLTETKSRVAFAV